MKQKTQIELYKQKLAECKDEEKSKFLANVIKILQFKKRKNANKK